MGGVGFGQEGEGIIYAGELGGLPYLPLVIVVGSFLDGWPDVLRERLVGVCCDRQLAAYPGFCDRFVSMYPVVYIPGAFGQGSVGFFDSLHSLIGFVDRIAV